MNILSSDLPLSYWGRLIAPVWVLLAVLFCLINFPPVSHLLVDPDDYLRGMRVFELIEGEGHPYLVSRLGLEPGTEVLWSRLVDWIVAVPVMILTIFTGSQEAALYWVATALPLMQLLALMFLACWCVAPLTGNRQAVAAVFLLFLSIKMLMEFKTGRIDHHSWQIMVMLGGYGALTRMYFEPHDFRWPMIAGFSFATGLAIGADIILWAGLGAMLAGLFWLREGRDYERANILFGLTLFTASIFYFLLLRPAHYFYAPACDGLSLTYLAIALAVPLFWHGIAALPSITKSYFSSRLEMSLLLGGLLLIALYFLFPKCFDNPYGLSPTMRYLWLSQVIEARPVWTHMARHPVDSLLYLLPAVLGFAASYWACKADQDRRGFWIAFTVVLGLGLAAGLAQIRVLTFTQVLALWPLSWAVMEVWGRLSSARGSVNLIIFCWIAGIALLAGIHMLQKDDAPVTTDTKQACDIRPLAERLDEIDPTTILSSYIFNGSEFLFRTHHRVLAAPYHRNGPSMRIMYDIFSADAAAAEELAAKNGIGMVVVCQDLWPFAQETMPDKDNLIRGLMADRPPSWLKRAPENEAGGFKVYRVRR